MVAQADFSYDDSTYVQRVTELMLEEYELQYDGGGNTQPSS